MSERVELATTQTCFTDLRDEGPTPREKQTRDYLRDNPQGDRCSRCDAPVSVGPSP